MRSAPQPTSGTIQPTDSAGSALIPREGDHPTKLVMLTFSGTNSANIALGDASVDAADSPLFIMSEECSGMVINVAGRTHIAWSAASGGSLGVTALGY